MLTYHNNVIELPVPKTWRFFDFLSANGANPIEGWYQRDLSYGAQFEFDAMLKECQKTEKHTDWLHYKGHLKGKCSDYNIFELYFSCGDKLQHRVLVKFGPGRKQLTLLVGCYHKGRVYTPSNALDIAYKRARLLSREEAYYYERKIDILR